MKNTQYSQKILSFHGRLAPEEGLLVGYSALIDFYKLQVPLPERIALISKKNRKYENSGWMVFGPRYKPDENLIDYLVFSLKYEGINLLFFKKLFQKISKAEIINIIKSGYSGIYNRKLWFLYEWLMGEKLPISDLKIKNSVPLIDEKLQYGCPEWINSPRHRIKNNLPGTVNFCPLIYKTPKLENLIRENLNEKINTVITSIGNDILRRTSSSLLLKDSKASFTIEGERPTNSRAVRWGRAISFAGSGNLSKDELLRLQHIVIGNSRFTKMGFRADDGFVGDYDRSTGELIPQHISARWQDINFLIDGLLEAARLMEEKNFHPVLIAAKIAFGFFIIHPFFDGNGRMHRYLIHHILAKTNFTPQGIIFPVSDAILERIEDYRKIMESYSLPLFDYIEWKKTLDNNIGVINETIDFYRYFDATRQAEFLFECVEQTINKIIPEEVSYIQKYDEMKAYIDEVFQMPDATIDLLIRLLGQNDGILPKRAKEKEFMLLIEPEIREIELVYKRIFYTKVTDDKVQELAHEQDEEQNSKEPMDGETYLRMMEERANLLKRREAGLRITYSKNS